MLSPGNSAEIVGNSAEIAGNSAEICRHFFWLYWDKHSTINSAEIGLQWWNSSESRFKSEIWKFCRNPKSAKTSIHLELSGKVLCEYSRYRLRFTKLIFDAYMGKVGRTSVFKISVQFLVLKQSAFQWRGKRKAMTVTLWKVNVFPESERQDGHSEMIPNTWPFQKLFLAGRLLIKALPKRAVCLKGSFFVENASCSCSKHHAVCAFNNANLCMQRTCKRN